MKKILLYSFLVAFAFLIGCQKKELPDAVDGTPVFSANLKFGDESTKSWHAGVDSFYMFTSYIKDQDGMLIYSGKMERENCSGDCLETLTILIRGIELDPLSSPVPDEAFLLDSYEYFNDNMEDSILRIDTTFLYETTLTADSSVVSLNSNILYEWQINGSFFGFSSNTSFELDQVIFTDVTLKVTDLSSGDSCVAWQTQTIEVEPSKRCAVRIQPEFNNDFVLESLEAIPMSSAATYSFEWTSGGSEDIFFGPFEPSVPYKVTMTDDFGCVSEAGFTWSAGIPQNPPMGCTSHFNYEINRIPVAYDSTVIPNIVQPYSKITIIYVDENGNSFRSDRLSQNPIADFKIHDFEPYDDNENGDPTRKLELQFNCSLWDENLNQLDIVDGQAVWGVAVPK